MIFALILIVAIALAIWVSPLIAVALFVVGAIGYLAMFGMRRGTDESTSAGPEARSAARGRREGRNTRIR